MWLILLALVHLKLGKGKPFYRPPGVMTLRHNICRLSPSPCILLSGIEFATSMAANRSYLTYTLTYLLMVRVPTSFWDLSGQFGAFQFLARVERFMTLLKASILFTANQRSCFDLNVYTCIEERLTRITGTLVSLVEDIIDVRAYHPSSSFQR